MHATVFLRRGLPALLVVATLLIGRAAPAHAQNTELPTVPILLSDAETIVSGDLAGPESVNVGVANAVPNDVPVVEHYPVPVTESASPPQGPDAPPPPPASGLSSIILGDIEAVGRDVNNALGLNAEPANEPYVPPPGATIIPPGPICTRNGVLGPC
jgi:hypothetical protein